MSEPPALPPTGPAPVVSKPRLPAWAIVLMAVSALLVGWILWTVAHLVGQITSRQEAVAASLDATARSQIANIVTHTTRLRATVEYYIAANRRCPSNAALSLPQPMTMDISGSALPGHEARILLGTTPAGLCVMELRFRSPYAGIDGMTLIYRHTGAGWDCREGTLPARYRPLQCR
jgi:Pilin (bacterial filament)